MERIPIKVRQHVYNGLPKGWVKIKSKSHPGRHWYLNKNTGEETWHKPLPEGWIKVWSTRSGRFQPLYNWFHPKESFTGSSCI